MQCLVTNSSQWGWPNVDGTIGQYYEGKYKEIVEEQGRDTARKLQHCTSRELVAMLGRAHYVRYDETTAQRLLDLSAKLNAEYAGKITHILNASESRADFEKRLGAFDGVGPKTIEIFMRDAAKVLF